MKKLINQILFKASGELPIRFIQSGGKDYLERYYLGKVAGVTFFLHRYIDGDGEREEVHDHPWDWSTGLVITGEYHEERMLKLDEAQGPITEMRHIKPLRPNWIKGDSFHRIDSIKPGTWTLFIHGPKTKTWGFLFKQDNGGWEYQQPNNLASTKKWYKSAPRGKQAARIPLT